MENLIFFEHQNLSYKHFHVYKRKSYFREKLHLLTGAKQSTSEEYVKVLDVIRQRPFSTIFELKKLLKSSGLGKWNRYIYSIYFDIKNTRLIDLKESDISYLEQQFFEFERKFKAHYPTKKYIINYNIIIYYLLMSNNYSCASAIISPRNYSKTIKKFIEILK